MQIPDLQLKARLLTASVEQQLAALPDDRILTPADTKPILKEARAALCAVMYLDDLVCGNKTPPLAP